MTGEMWGIDWVVVQGVATAVTALILLVTVLVARGQLRETKRLRDDQLRPHVLASIEPSAVRPILEFTVRNVGATSARSVHITADPPITTTKDDLGYPLAQSHLLTDGLSTLPPGHTVRALFDSMPSRRMANLPMRFTFTVSYEDVNGKRRTESQVVDLNELLGIMSVSRKGLHETAEAVEDMAARMREWTMSSRGLMVYSQDFERYGWANGYFREHPGLPQRLAIRWWNAIVSGVRRLLRAAPSR